MQHHVYCALEENTAIKLGSHNLVEHVMLVITALKAPKILILLVIFVKLVFIALLAAGNHKPAPEVPIILNFNRLQWMIVYHALEDHIVNLRMLQQQLDHVSRDIIVQQIVQHLIAGGWYVQLAVIVPWGLVHHCLVQLVHSPIPLASTLLQAACPALLATFVIQKVYLSLWDYVKHVIIALRDHPPWQPSHVQWVAIALQGLSYPFSVLMEHIQIFLSLSNV